MNGGSSVSALPDTARPDAALLRWLLPGLLVLAATLLLFRDTAAAMVSIWIRSETFTHAFLVPPIALWLVWRKRAQLAALQPRPSPVWLLPIAAVCFLWLLGELASVNAATQLALVSIIVLSVPAVFGWAVTRVLAFPLAFLFFAVPIGEFLTAPMIDRTADFTVAAIRLSGIPVYREGNQFVIPSGNWSVVEACSGVRYLIASFMVGTLFAYLNYRSLKRRLLFVAISILVPIVANWMRAYMIVMLGHASDNRLAVGADHLVYGWVFFGIVIMIMFMIGARFAEFAEEPALPAGAWRSASVAGSGPTWAVASGLLLLLLLTQAAFWKLEQQTAAPVAQLRLPAQLGEWRSDSQDVAQWTPAYHGARETAQATYRNGDAWVGVWIGYYRDQGQDRKLVTSTNALVAQQDKVWMPVDSRSMVLPENGGVLWRSTLIRTPADPKAAVRLRLHVLHQHWIGGRFVARDAEARLRLAFDRLLGRGDDAAVVIFYAPVPEDAKSSRELERFVVQHLGSFNAALDTVRSPSTPR